MEVYRTFNGPFPDCPSFEVLKKMYQIALPRLPVDDIADASIKDLNERDSKMFFPKRALEAIFDEATVGEVLKCNKVCCKHGRESNLSESPILIASVVNNARTLLAVLVYLGHTAWMKTFRQWRIGDDNLDRLPSKCDDERPAGLSVNFAKSYQHALELFRPQVFVMGDPQYIYEDHERFPYVEDRLWKKGSFGEVRRFEIHPDYLDSSLARIAAKYSPPSALAKKSTVSPAVFARKILRYTLDDSEFDMEKQVLRIIDQQQHNNIIDLVAFYSWRGDLNCIFPFVAKNLHEVLHENWKPESIVSTVPSPKHWLWQQMILVADALQTIHNPPTQPEYKHGRIVGFHFDLKPMNILVTPDGILKITDFGQSMVKMVEDRESAYGTYVGGDFAYGPPEVVLTRGELKELRETVFPPSLQSHQLPAPLTPPSTSSRQSSSALSHVSSYDSRRTSSIISLQSVTGGFQEPQLAQRHDSCTSSVFAMSSTSIDDPQVTVTANYDVWSLACIMTEALVFIYEGGTRAVVAFENLRKKEPRDLSFHTGTQDADCLKYCVRELFDRLRSRDHAGAISTSAQPASYLSEIVNLLERMLVADPSQRLSSEQVVAELATFDKIYQQEIGPDADIIRLMRGLLPFEGFTELGYGRDQCIVPFYNMANIKLEIDAQTIPDCRLQLFRKPGVVGIRIRYGDGYMHELSNRFDTEDSYFYPIYLFDPLRRNVCGLKDKNTQIILHFGSKEELMTFQTAIMRYKARIGIRVSEVVLQPTSGENDRYNNLHDPDAWARCQVWQAQDSQFVPTRSSGTAQGIMPINVMFFKPEGFFGIPLQVGKKMIREKVDSLKEVVKKVVIEKPDRFNQYFHYIKSGFPTLAMAHGEPVCPAIPLSSNWLKPDESTRESRRANKVEIVFPDHSDLLLFKREVARANRQNPHETLRIHWKDAQRHQEANRGIFRSQTWQ